jgi:hypothetical protein
MGDDGDLRFQWALRRTSWTPAQASHLVTVLADAAEDACAVHFPASEGYETRATQLHGMVEGVRVCVSKGEFSAVVSTQCYLEAVGGPRPAREMAVRMVAAVHQAHREDLGTARLLEIVKPVFLMLLGSAAAFALISTLWVDGIGGYFRLSLWMSFMIMMAPAVAWMLGARTTMQLEAIEATRTQFQHRARSFADHESRWRRVLDAMHDQQALVLQHRALPFRR